MKGLKKQGTCLRNAILVLTARRTLASLLCFGALSVTAAPTAYKVERVVYPRSYSYSDNINSLDAPLAQIELGAVEHPPKPLPLPKREAFKSMILIGTDGIANNVSLYEFEKRCEYLCGDEAEECHYTALIHYGGQAIGTPLLTLVSVEGEAKNFSVLKESVRDELPTLSLGKQKLVWPADNYVTLQLQASTVEFTMNYAGDPPYAYEAMAPDCRVLDYQDTGFSRLSCNSVEFLLHNEELMLFSSADYNLSSVQVLNRFELNDQTYYTVLLALKAYTAYGLLTNDGNGWRFIVKPADWARLC